MSKELLNLEDNKTDPSVQDDFDFARASVYNLADKSQEAIDLMMDVARESEHPRAFEVLSNMIKQNADLVEQLMIMQQRKQKLEEPKKKEEAQKITNNNVFVGTTEDLQRLLMKSSNEKDVIDNVE